MKKKDMNRVVLRGVMCDNLQISHEFEDKEFFTFSLKVRRNEEKEDYIPILISEDMIFMYQEDTFVEIIGQYVSERVGRKAFLYVYATKIELTQKNYTNRVNIVGTICKKTVNKGYETKVVEFILATNSDTGYSSYIPTIAIGDNAIIVKEFSVGQRVFCYGSIRMKEYDKKLEDGTIEKRTALNFLIKRAEKK